MLRRWIALVLIGGLGACATNAAIDQTNPESVVQAIFSAANSEDFVAVKDLCDPQGENDSDTQDICNLADGDPEFQQEFVKYFAKGETTGDVEIKDDQAMVPILFGPEGDREETMVLVKREDNWYLSSF